jgi:hypothetical protein
VLSLRSSPNQFQKTLPIARNFLAGRFSRWMIEMVSGSSKKQSGNRGGDLSNDSLKKSPGDL